MKKIPLNHTIWNVGRNCRPVLRLNTGGHGWNTHAVERLQVFPRHKRCMLPEAILESYTVLASHVGTRDTLAVNSPLISKAEPVIRRAFASTREVRKNLPFHFFPLAFPQQELTSEMTAEQSSSPRLLETNFRTYSLVMTNVDDSAISVRLILRIRYDRLSLGLSGGTSPDTMLADLLFCVLCVLRAWREGRGHTGVAKSALCIRSRVQGE